MSLDITIAIASDHNGVDLKDFLYNCLKQKNINVVDLGPYNKESVDYVDYAYQMGNIIDSGDIKRGILICGTGVGMSIAANRFKNVRATLIHNLDSAPKCREHNDSNILCLGSWISTPSASELILNEWLSTQFGEGRHVKRVEKISGRKPQSIVFTNGVFDILHAGHLETLKFAKSLGDKLVVGINSDESTKKIKGPQRPINNQEDRKKILSYISLVDEVVIFNDIDTKNIINNIDPDIVVKGGEFTAAEVRERDKIPNHIDVKVASLLNQDIYSTTKVVEKIKQYA
jgi:ribose 5-phosphate isomerase B